MTFLVTYDVYGMLVFANDEVEAYTKAAACGMACIDHATRVRYQPRAKYNTVIRKVGP